MRITFGRHSDHPARWDDTETPSRAVWPEYNLHGRCWGATGNGLFDDFPDYG